MSSATNEGPATAPTCCPPFDPSLYREADGVDYKILQWNSKPFIKEGTWCFYYVPLSYGKALGRATKKLEDAGAALPEKDAIVLSDCDSAWYSTMLVSSAKEEVPGAEMVTLSGTYLAKVFEGEYKEMCEWIKATKSLVAQLKEEKKVECEDVEKMQFLFYYTTCPKCAKKYGKNFVVVFAKLSDK